MTDDDTTTPFFDGTPPKKRYYEEPRKIIQNQTVIELILAIAAPSAFVLGWWIFGTIEAFPITVPIIATAYIICLVIFGIAQVAHWFVSHKVE